MCGLMLFRSVSCIFSSENLLFLSVCILKNYNKLEAIKAHPRRYMQPVVRMYHRCFSSWYTRFCFCDLWSVPILPCRTDGVQFTPRACFAWVFLLFSPLLTSFFPLQKLLKVIRKSWLSSRSESILFFLSMRRGNKPLLSGPQLSTPCWRPRVVHHESSGAAGAGGLQAPAANPGGLRSERSQGAGGHVPPRRLQRRRGAGPRPRHGPRSAASPHAVAAHGGGRG